MATIDIKSTIEASKKLFDFTIQRIDDWKNVVPEGKALQKECELFQGIISHVVDKPHLHISSILEDVNETMENTNTMIDDFLKDDTRNRPFFSGVGWMMQRPWLAYNHRATFKATTEYLENCKKKIQETLHDSSQINKPTAQWYYDKMVNKESFAFWTDISGEEVQALTWTMFTETYQDRYNVKWDSNIIESIRRFACKDGIHLTISGYIELTKLCGFPLEVRMLPLLTDLHPTVSFQTRMEAVRMINELVTYYSTKEMRDSLAAIIIWYKGCKNLDRQEQANEWARVLLSNRGKPTSELDERGKLVEQVDMARCTYSFFYQRYLGVFKTGQFTKDMLAELDFPGRARINEFLGYVEPLDNAYYHVVMNNTHGFWEHNKPKVYKFFTDLFESERKAEEEARTRAEVRAMEFAEAIERNAHDEEAIKKLVMANNDIMQFSKFH